MARAMVVALAWRPAGSGLERAPAALAAHHARTNPRMGGAGNRLRGRLLPWFAVAYGAGIVLYFTAEREPSLWAAATLTGICAIAALSLRKRFAAFVIALGVFGIALGFAVATFKTSLIAPRSFPVSGTCCRFPAIVSRRRANRNRKRPVNVRVRRFVLSSQSSRSSH